VPTFFGDSFLATPKKKQNKEKKRMSKFFKSIGNDLSSVANFVGSKVSEGFDDVENIAKSGAGYINNVKDQSFGLANHLVSGAQDLGDKTIGGVKDIVQKGESIISLPLIIVAGGLAFFLLSKNAGEAIKVGGQLGSQALKNPAVMGL
jgi:hypothetical protein